MCLNDSLVYTLQHFFQINLSRYFSSHETFVGGSFSKFCCSLGREKAQFWSIKWNPNPQNKTFLWLASGKLMLIQKGHLNENMLIAKWLCSLTFVIFQKKWVPSLLKQHKSFFIRITWKPSFCRLRANRLAPNLASSSLQRQESSINKNTTYAHAHTYYIVNGSFCSLSTT